ncbi:MAG: hypothetical protein HZB54_04785 [Deltaproteobacteria bacterium]|nr:hypothetical protein [Deltaproteobacteria bacterium]
MHVDIKKNVSFHINRVDDGEATKHYSSEILHHIVKAWKLFFKSNNNEDVYTRFAQQKLSDKDLINKVSEYYVDNKQNFTKHFVFVIDDVDLLPGDHVATVSDCILRNMGTASVKKWLVLRDITYDNYKGTTKQRIEQFFPDPYSFPTISLHELVAHRIKASGPKATAKNPFTTNLCDSVVKPICEWNMREGLSLLKSLLEDNLPKDIDPSASEEFIQNYIEKAAINTFLKSHKLLDLHADIFRVGIYPLAIDILCCAIYHSAESIIYGAVNDCTIRRDVLSGRVIGTEEATVKVRQRDFSYVADKLSEHGLIKLDKKAHLMRPTEKGKTLASFAVGAHYYKFCRSKEVAASVGKEYWTLASKEIDHQKIVSTFLAWKHQHS